MRAALIGYGRMGHMVAECMAEQGDLAVAGIVDTDQLPSLADVPSPDVAIDFSFPGDLEDVLSVARRRHIPLVIGRTGLDDAQRAQIARAAQDIPIVCAGNFSVGVAVIRRMARQMAGALGEGFDIEIVEAHHRMKKDAPSGTAAMLVDAVDPGGRREVVHGRDGFAVRTQGEIGVHALRGGSVCGDHTVYFLGDMEQLSIGHRAESRRVFALGALRAARFVVDQPAGLYDMDDVLFGAQDAKEGTADGCV